MIKKSTLGRIVYYYDTFDKRDHKIKNGVITGNYNKNCIWLILNNGEKTYKCKKCLFGTKLKCIENAISKIVPRLDALRTQKEKCKKVNR